MPYQIEVMSIGEDLYPALKRCADALNGVQDEFKFHLTSTALRASGIGFTRSQYLTTDLWTFLREQREKVGGHRPYIIAFVTRPLASPRLSNIFGSHEGGEGLAVATTHGTAQYVREEGRYVCYYLVRYALSFVNPSIKAHHDEGRKDCYFHAKTFKPEIRASMDSAQVCDECMRRLDTPLPEDNAHRLSDGERAALVKMRQFVSGDLPYAIVMKGGGVKGLAFAGALMEIEKYFWFDRHVGTSAGAITAVLLAAAYTPSELTDLLLKKDFRTFMDAPLWRVPINLILHGGLYPGDSFYQWMAELMARKFNRVGEVPMQALNGALVYAARRGTGTLPFDSNGERKETAAAFATRCSMSIPVFFFPAQVEGRRVFDGGMRNNFPLARFLTDDRRSHFIALYLGKPDNRSRRSFGSELLDIIIEGEERQTVDNNRQSVVVIDTSPIGTVDFSLSDREKNFLVQVGKAAALKFLRERKLDNGPLQAEVDRAHQEAEQSRAEVITLRNRRRTRRLVWTVILLVLMLGALHLLGWSPPWLGRWLARWT